MRSSPSKRITHPPNKYVKQLRSLLPQKFPGTTFSFLPADIVSQILNFGLPAPIDVQVIGNNQAANYAYATDLLKRMRTGARHCRPAHPAGVQLSADQCRGRPHARRRGRADAARRRQQPSGHVVGQPAGAPEFLAQSGERRLLSVGRADAAIPRSTPCRISPTSRLTSAETKRRNISADLPRSRPDQARASYRTTTCSRWSTFTAPSRLAISERLPADINRILQDTRKDVPRGSYVVLRGQVQTMTNAYSQLYFGLAGAIVLIYLVIVVNFQSWLDPFIIITALPERSPASSGCCS